MHIRPTESLRLYSYVHVFRDEHLELDTLCVISFLGPNDSPSNSSHFPQ